MYVNVANPLLKSFLHIDRGLRKGSGCSVFLLPLLGALLTPYLHRATVHLGDLYVRLPDPPQISQPIIVSFSQ